MPRPAVESALFSGVMTRAELESTLTGLTSGGLAYPWETHDVRRSHESAARALRFDGPSHGLAPEECRIADMGYLADGGEHGVGLVVIPAVWSVK